MPVFPSSPPPLGLKANLLHHAGFDRRFPNFPDQAISSSLHPLSRYALHGDARQCNAVQFRSPRFASVDR
jgi:hypothetical protein